jgi:hypothetical protein
MTRWKFGRVQIKSAVKRRLDLLKAKEWLDETDNHVLSISNVHDVNTFEEWLNVLEDGESI